MTTETDIDLSIETFVKRWLAWKEKQYGKEPRTIEIFCKNRDLPLPKGEWQNDKEWKERAQAWLGRVFYEDL